MWIIFPILLMPITSWGLFRAGIPPPRRAQRAPLLQRPEGIVRGFEIFDVFLELKINLVEELKKIQRMWVFI